MLLRVSIAKAGEDVSRCPEFAKPEVTIGRRPTNDVILPDDGVSGAHAKLLVTGRTLTLIDQGSTNGTFVGGERVEGPRSVGPHDEVLISDYRLTFSLVDEVIADDGSVRTPVAPGGTAEVPLSEALGWTEEGDLPPPPPMLDVSAPVPVATPPTSPSPAASATAYSAPAASITAYSAPSRPVSKPVPVAVVPSASPFVDVPTRTDDDPFDFDPHGPVSLHEQVFAAVWARVSEDVVASAPGVDRRVGILLTRAVAVASQVGQLASGTQEQIIAEITTMQVVESLLKGEPDDVLVQGIAGVRIDRRGHVSIGPSPLSCATAVLALGSRLCQTVLTPHHPVARRAYGPYVVQAIHGSAAGGVHTLSLRRSPNRPSSIEELESAGAISTTHAHILRATVRAGLRIVLCVGPGTSGRPILGALMAAAASTELQIVVAPAGADLRNLRSGTVLLTRGSDVDAVETALRLGPSRLALEDMAWGDIYEMDALTASSTRVIASIAARNPWVGMQRLTAMLERSQGSGPSAPAFLASSIDLFVTVGASRDGTPHITGLTEPVVSTTGEVELSDLTTYDPQTQTWTARFGSSPCLDDLVHRGLLDPRVFQAMPTSEPTG